MLMCTHVKYTHAYVHVCAKYNYLQRAKLLDQRKLTYLFDINSAKILIPKCLMDHIFTAGK